MPSRFLRHLLLVTLTLALGLAGSGPAAAATFLVDNCTDTPSAGTLTLRQAVTTAGASGDTTDLITFVAGSCIITLADGVDDDLNVSGDIDILSAAKTLTLQGSGPGVTVVDGGAFDRVFDTAAGVTLVIRNMTIRNGDATQNVAFSKVGGAIFNGGTLTLEDVVLSGSQATQGGAIFNGTDASLTATRVTINGNTVSAPGDGGGIFVAGGTTGTVTVTNSTISGNTGTGDGGGIATLAGSTVQLTNVTITGNTANRGGGIDNSGTMTLLNTIVAGNNGATFTDCIGALTTQGNNLFGSNTECSGNLGGITTDIASTTPGLGPLADNGGPTPTHALLATSPALNAGASAGCPATDQRVILRPKRGVASATTAVCDIGAFELVLEQASLALSLNQTSFTTGQTLLASVTASNTGDAVVMDVLFGIVVPASAALSLGCSPGVAPLAFITQVTPVVTVAFRCSNASPATFPTLLADNVFQPTPSFTVSNFFGVQFPAQTPRGSYLLFLVLLRAGALDDGSLDTGDIIAFDTVAFDIL